MQDEKEFRQDPLEDRLWDEAVFGEFYGAFQEALQGKATPTIGLGALEPLQQALLANAFSMVNPASQPKPTLALRTANPILAAGLEWYREQIGLPLYSATSGYAWVPIQAIPLAAVDVHFDVFLSGMLHRAGADNALEGDERLNFNALLFHPLQNAATHGKQGRGDPDARFSGLAIRRTRAVHPVPPSLRQYLTTRQGNDGEFLEIVIHDDGLGIAGHYYRAHNEEGAGELRTQPVSREWINLNLAVELHASSRPQPSQKGYPRRRLGVGLFDLLQRLQRLRGYLELRSGRIRASRWFSPGEPIDRQTQLQPHGGRPAAAEYCPGTVFRLFLPIGGRDADLGGKE